MRRVLLMVLLAWGGLGTAQAFLEVVSPRARVLYADPALGPFAQEVARAAERALDVLEPLFGLPETPITLRLRDDTDVYNAFASPLPRPYADLRALFPVGGETGYGGDPLYLLVLHELAHLAHLGDTRVPDGGGGGLGLGLVGDGVARVPPMWVLEGLATWLESEHTGGGRRDDPRTLGVLYTLARDEAAWPSLERAGLGHVPAWPGGMTRYWLGVGFLDFLIGRVGFEGVLAALRHYNAVGFLGTFEAAWRAAHGQDLEAEWAAWRAALERDATARATDTTALEPLTESGWYTGGAALAPDGETLAWVGSPSAIRVARLTPEGLADARTMLPDRRPDRLAWLDADTLVYSAAVRRPGTQYLELFALEVATGRETQLTAGARARLPAPDPEGCILYIRDTAVDGVRLMRWCRGATQTLWRAPAGWHLVGLAVSGGGRVALSVWRQGRVDLALLEGATLRWLTDGASTDTDPRFHGEDTLVFTSDRDGGLESYRLGLASGRLERLTRTVGGASEPLVAGDSLVVRALGSAGYDLARLPLEPLEARPTPPSPHSPAGSPPREATYPVRPYSPWATLAPHGWLPAAADASLSPLGVSVGATVFGQDASNEHAYAVSAGYAPAQGGPLAGGHLSASYQYRANTVLTALVPPHPLSFGVRFGLWPHAAAGPTAIAAGAQVQVGVTWPLDLWTLYGVAETGLLHLGGAWQPDARAALTLSRQRRDDWNYVTRGTRFAVTARVAATVSGPRSALWASAEHHAPVALGPLSGTAELEARAGYRVPPPIPATSAGWAAFGTLGYRLSLPTPLRYGDGLYALERVTLEPRLRLWVDGGVSVGADVSAFLDALLNYAAPVSAGVSVGYANGFWYGVGFRLGL